MLARTRRAGVVLLALLATLAVPMAGHAATTVVSPADMGDWTFDNQGASAAGSFANGPAAPPLGLGSLKQVANSGDKQITQTRTFNGVPLAGIQMSFATYSTSAPPTILTAALNISVDNTGDGFSDETLVFEPYEQSSYTVGYPATVQNVWQTWDVDAGKVWGSVSGITGPRFSLASYAASHPGATIAQLSPAAFRLVIGSTGTSWPNFTGYVDAVTVNATTIDFEAAPQTLNCNTVMDDLAAIQAAVNAAPNGGTIRLSGICDFTRAPAHGGDISSVANTAILIRPGTPVSGLTIESDGAPQSATILGAGLQAAFTIAPGNNNVTIRGLRFVNVARAVVAVNTTNTTVGFNGALPDGRANRIIGSVTMDSAILGLAVDRGPSVSSPTGTVTINYGAAATPAAFTGQGLGTLRNFTVAGNYVTFAPPGPGVPDVVAVDVRQRYERVVDGVLIRHNAVGMASPVFPNVNQSAIKMHSMTPLSTAPTGTVNDYYIRNVIIDGNNLGRLEELGDPLADIHAAGRVGIALTGVGNFTVSDNGVRVIESPTVIPMPGGGIIASDSGFGRIGPGNVVNVIADPTTINSDFGAIGVVDDIGTLFGDPAKPQATRNVLVDNNVVGTLDPSTDGIAQRGIVVANAELITVRNNTTEFTTDAALNIAPVLEGPGSIAAPGVVRLPAAVRASSFCGNTLDGTVDDPNEVSFGEGGPGSVANSLPAGAAPANGPCTGPALIITHTDGATTLAEAPVPPTDTYSIALSFRPTAPVTVTPSPDAQVTVATPPLVFTPYTWNVPQNVIVAAVDDALVEGGHTGTITNTTVSSDPAYSALALPVLASITDNDFGQIAVTPQTLTVTEGGPAATYTIALSAPPPSNVTVQAQGDAQVALSPASVTFSPANYAIPQTVSVTAVNDLYRELPKLSTITHKSLSAASAWNNVTGPNVLVTVLDNDVPNPPAITAPGPNSCIGTNNVTFTGTAEPNGSVQLFEGATSLGTAAVGGTGAWSLGPVFFADGVHQVTGRTTGWDALVGPGSTPRTFRVDTAAPAVPVVTSPSNGATLTGSPITLTGTAEPFARVVIRRGTSIVAQNIANGSGVWTATAALPLGPHALTVSAVDCAQNESVATAAINIVIAAPTPPVILTPAEGSFQPATVIVTGTGPSGATITLKDAGTTIQTGIPVIAGTWQTTRTFGDGVHTLTAVSVAGSMSSTPSAIRTFNVDTMPPTIAFDQPSLLGIAELALPPSPVNLQGIARDNFAVVRIDLTYYDFLTGDLVATGTASCALCPAGNVVWTHDPVLLPGVYTVEAVATDLVGLTSRDEMILVTIAV